MTVKKQADMLQLFPQKNLGETILGCLMLASGLACLYGASIAYSQEWHDLFGDLLEVFRLFVAILGAVIGIGLSGGGGLLIFSKSNKHVFDKRKNSFTSSGHLSSSLTGTTSKLGDIIAVFICPKKEGTNEWYCVGLLLGSHNRMFLPERFSSFQKAERIALTISEFCKIPVDPGGDGNSTVASWKHIT